MKTTKIKFNSPKLSDSNLESLALAIATAMTGNTHFPEPEPSLAALNDSIKAYSDALALAKTRDKVKVAIKNTLKEALLLNLRKMASYCSMVADRDRAKLVSSGFPVNAESFAVKTLSAPENFSVQVGINSGEAIVSIKRIANAKAFILYYKPAAGNGDWIHVTNSLPKFTLTGLEALASYQFKMGVIGTKGQITYTDTITKAVL